MPYHVSNDLLVGPNVTYTDTRKKGGPNKPKFAILHYTASDNYQQDVTTLSSSSRKASCQIVIGIKGEITQIGKFTDRMWQAGESAWKGYTELNGHSIGFEFTCPGPVDRDQARYGAKYAISHSPYVLASARHRNGGPLRTWALFTDEQIDVAKEIIPVIMEHYGLKEAVGHDQIAPSRKIDPGPSCPQSLFDFLNGDKEDVPEPDRVDLPAIGKLKVKGLPAGEKLAFRHAPNGEKRGDGLPEGAIVEELSRSGNWVNVRTPAGFVGFVWKDFVEGVPT